MITGNKGEWSEVYVLLKILSDKRLFEGDADLRVVESAIFPIVKVLREESGGTFEFSYDDNLVVVSHGCAEFRIPVIEFGRQATCLLSTLRGKTETTFSIPEIETFIGRYNSHSLKAKSSKKSDIRVVIHDPRTAASPELGFSIKSRLGSPSTLLNAVRATNFTYRICDGLSDDRAVQINEISTRSKVRDRLASLGRLEFERMDDPVFESNLTLIDSSLPRIVSEMVLQYFSTGVSRVCELVDCVTELNPLNYNQSGSHPFYAYKVKKFLTDIALGMTPAAVWTGQLDATGGYLVVKGDGEVLCYHIYNRNEFEDYLFQNTKFDTASTSRHEFGTAYSSGGEWFVKLNLQIRFV